MRIRSIAAGSILLAGFAVCVIPGHAQLNCSLGRVIERVAPQYPMQTESRPIEGLVSIFATFAPDGRVTSSKVITGPSVLRFESESYIRGWRAEARSDVRQCAITLEYRFEGAPNACNSHNTVHVRAERLDDTHVLMHLGCGGW